ncbi:CRISPR-associated protein Csh1 [Ruminiclostridium sufflavum DSM 19573]|uniref:CRISPR-associated protein Csh1 n=1 Tax=Ruminiclostridium sufflavum DSM 19573 TaxID=1121337 RepID=A0A318XMV8_9FIRM|nr:hypothetical protein [Ruminiclostridium sufflavum]PYG86979.1 CRISPR-associated protein Csh1 [Ruminiclostridium sufflavum DSM 19573]
MFVDLIRLFSEIPDFRQVVLDNYRLGNGMYIVVEDGRIETLTNIDKDTDCSEYDWLKSADYYSQLIDMNKAVDSNKKIHSCSPFAVFIKADTLPEYGTGDKVLSMEEFEQAIIRYYGILTSNGKADSKAAEILKTADLPEADAGLFESCKNWLLNNLNEIIQAVKEKPPVKGSYLKIFFKQALEKYEIEYRRYLLPKIFNKNDYNIVENGKLLGLSNYNMGLNAKKPYLELMGTRFKVPFRIGLDDSMTLKCFFEWIQDYKTSEGKHPNSVYLPSGEREALDFSKDFNKFVSGYFLNFKQKKDGIYIADFECLPSDPDEKPFFRIENCLGADNWRYTNLYEVWQLEKITDDVFFSKRLIKNYTVDTGDMQSDYKAGEYTKNLENLMLRYRKALHNYFRKGDRKALEYCADAMSKSMVLEILRFDEENGYWKAAAAFNLRMALLKQIKTGGDGGMGDFIIELSEIVRKKRDFQGVQPQCDNDKEFFFLCGQLVRYLFSLSEASNPKHSFAESFLKAKDSAVLKRKLRELYITYGHKILLKSSRFDNLMSMAVGYEADTLLRDYEDYFLAGFLSKNLLYEKKQEAE